MKSHLFKITSNPNESFHIRRDNLPQNPLWHYHVEIELMYIKKGEGTLIVGNAIRDVKPGQFYLLGTNLPHFWRFKKSDLQATEDLDVIVVHFRHNFLGQSFFDTPELSEISKMLERAKRGLKFHSDADAKMGELFEQCMATEGVDRLLTLLRILQRFAGNSEDLLSLEYAGSYKKTDEDRINAIFEFSVRNFREKMILDDVAREANMNPHSFCRYFKAKTGKTFTQFLAELRVGHACKQLMETNKTMQQVCFESGFNNTTSFHQFFKKITGMSPAAYRKDVRQD